MNTEQTPDLGVLLFEKSNAKHELDAPTGKVGAKGMAMRIYMFLLGAGLFGWFLYSLINMAADPEIGVGQAILRHLLPFFVLFVAEFILFLSAFGAWGKFTRKVLRRPELTHQRGIEGARTRQLQEEFAQVDANKDAENAIRVYRDYVVVVNDGVETLIDRAQLQRVKCTAAPKGYLLTFELYESNVDANLPVPIADLPMIKKHFDNFDVPAPNREKGYFKKKLPNVAVALIPVLIGVALIILRLTVLNDMPIIFGAFFLAVGLVFLIGQFDDVALIRNGVIPILFGLLFTGLPIGIGLTIAELVEEITFAVILTTFTPVHAVLSLFLGLGPMMIIIGIGGIVDCSKL